MASTHSNGKLPINGNIDDFESSASSSIVESCIVNSLSASETDGEQHLLDRDESEHYTNISELPILNQLLDSYSLKKQLEEIAPLSTYNNVSVSNSSNVVFGNVIKVKGVLNINLCNKTNTNNDDNRDQRKQSSVSVHNRGKSSEQGERRSNSICNIIPRSCWCALEASGQHEYIKEPVDIVVISHTNSDSSTSVARNMEIVRNIQTFHIDSQGWEDIGYNFLIGCDGNIYEGRGWGVVGAHTYGYNRKSIGITFIGCFMVSLPTENALKACQNLLSRGVYEGYLTDNYKLLGHRQCMQTVSPGKLLFEEISKWDHFYNKSIYEGLNN